MRGRPFEPGNTMGNLENEQDQGLVPLNFKVPEDFRREFKIFAALQDMHMVEVLQEAFILYKRDKTK